MSRAQEGRLWSAVIVAAGRGVRFGRPKQFHELAGVPMVAWSIQTFSRMPEIAEIVVVTERDHIERMRELVGQIVPAHSTRVVEGGVSRQESVYYGLRAVSTQCKAVLVHDGARPLVRADEVLTAMNEVREGRGALLAVPVVDTIKIVDRGAMTVAQTLERAALWAAQTPQLALTAELLAAHERARAEGVDATDDAALLERAGIDVVVVPASTENFKVTLPEDVARAEALLRERLSSANGKSTIR